MPNGERPPIHQSAPEALLVCPICQYGLVAADYETHLRRVHRLYGYRGVRRSLDDTVEAMLDDLLKLPPFAVAWPALVRLAREEHGGQPEPFLARRLSHALSRLPANNRVKVLPELAGLIAPGNAPLLALLAAENDVAARRLVLAGVPFLPAPLDPLLMKPLRALLLDRRLPEDEQVQALAAVLPGIKDPQLTRDLLEKLIDGLGKAQAVSRLNLLEDQTDSNPVLDAFADRMQEQVRMSCPCCPVQLRRAAMIQHLWQEHRLVLDGLRVRDPWGLIEDWLDAYKHNHNDELLTRCRVAAAKIDPDTGLVRLQRLALARNLTDNDTRRAVLEEAREQNASCCPECFSFVPAPSEAPIPPINLRPGRLSARGYSVEIDESGVMTRLEVRTPLGVLYQGREPNRPITPRGIALLAAGPLVQVALLFAFVWPATPIAPIRPVAVLLGLALGVHTLIRLMWRSGASVVERLLDYTWRFLVPRLHEKAFSESDSAFAAGLARLYTSRPADVPPEELARLLRITEQAVKRENAPPGHLAELCRLEIARLAARGDDPVLPVARWVGRCFSGKLSLAFAQNLLHGWQSTWWTPGNLTRLRILLCDLAFEAGFEVRNLVEAGRTAPALGAVLKTDAPQVLASLRLLWSLRPSRPWDRFGTNVLTAFEMAADPDHASELIEHPDVVLWQQVPGCLVVAEGGRDKLTVATIQLTLLGVWLQDVVFRDPPRVCEVRLRSTGCEMKLGPHAFRSPIDLDPLSRQLEKWFRFGFHEFLPQLDRVLTWQPPDRAAILRSWGAVSCPECGKRLLPLAGEVGIAVEEKT